MSRFSNSIFALAAVLAGLAGLVMAVALFFSIEGSARIRIADQTEHKTLIMLISSQNLEREILLHEPKGRTLNNLNRLVGIKTIFERQPDIDTSRAIIHRLDHDPKLDDAQELVSHVKRVLKADFRSKFIVHDDAVYSASTFWWIGAFLLMLSILVGYIAMREQKIRTSNLREAAYMAEIRIREEATAVRSRLIEILNKSGQSLISQGDLPQLLRSVTNSGSEITNATWSAFYYASNNGASEVLDFNLASFAYLKLPYDGARELFCSGDIRVDERLNLPESVMSTDIRSYISVPILLRNGEYVGTLLYGHREPDYFNHEHESSLLGLAVMAAIAIENLLLYQEARAEIEERKQTEDRLQALTNNQTLLMGELNHRVKNVLATVQSLASQTTNTVVNRHTDGTEGNSLLVLEDFTESFESRLQALSRAHNLLVRDNWQGVPLVDTIKTSLSALTTEDRFGVEVDGPTLVLSPHAAQSITLVIHELTTNAIKYGALSNSDGRISVSIALDSERLTIAWREQGGPTVNEPTRTGFGSKLIRRSVEREMRGKANIAYNQDGLSVDLTMPRIARLEAKLSAEG